MKLVFSAPGLAPLKGQLPCALWWAMGSALHPLAHLQSPARAPLCFFHSLHKVLAQLYGTHTFVWSRPSKSGNVMWVVLCTSSHCTGDGSKSGTQWLSRVLLYVFGIHGLDLNLSANLLSSLGWFYFQCPSSRGGRWIAVQFSF